MNKKQERKMDASASLLAELAKVNVHPWGGPDAAVDIDGKQLALTRLGVKPNRVYLYTDDRQIGASTQGAGWVTVDWPSSVSTDEEVVAFVATWKP